MGKLIDSLSQTDHIQVFFLQGGNICICIPQSALKIHIQHKAVAQRTVIFLNPISDTQPINFPIF